MRRFVAGTAAGVALTATAYAGATGARYFFPRPGDDIEMRDLQALCVYLMNRDGAPYLTCGRNETVRHPGSHFKVVLTRRYAELQNLRTGRTWRLVDNP